MFFGIKYCFEIVLEGLNGIEGVFWIVCNRIVFSVVFDIYVVYVIIMEMWLEWKSLGNVFEYVYYLVIEFKYGCNYINIFDNVVIFEGLILGILYNIIIFLEVDYVLGDFSFII